MPGQFLHGVEVVEVDSGTRPIQTVKSSVIGLVGTAPDADAIAFPINTPVLIAGKRSEAAGLDVTGNGSGTLPAAIDGIFDQVGAAVVVVRVEGDADDAVTKANIIGAADSEGLKALLDAESVLGVEPRIIIAPGFSDEQAVATEINVVADRLRGIGIIEGPSTDDAEANAYTGNFGGRRLYLVDPAVKVFDATAAREAIEPNSARVAGLMAWSDNARGFWWSPSNVEIKGVIGTERPISFKLGDFNSRANLLNENKVAVIVRQNGYRLWGNRTLSADPKWAFINVVRTNDLIIDSIQRAHLWAVDRNITKTYLDDVVEGVNNYLRELTGLGAILGGRAWADEELNAPASLAAGRVYIDFEFTPPAPAEHIVFRAHLVDDYFTEVLN